MNSSRIVASASCARSRWKPVPAPKEEDLAKGIIDTIDMDTYRVDKQAAMKIALADTDAAIDPSSCDGGGFKSVPDLDRLSSILKAFNESFGMLFTDSYRVVKKIREEVAEYKPMPPTKTPSRTHRTPPAWRMTRL